MYKIIEYDPGYVWNELMKQDNFYLLQAPSPMKEKLVSEGYGDEIIGWLGDENRIESLVKFKKYD